MLSNGDAVNGVLILRCVCVCVCVCLSSSACCISYRLLISYGDPGHVLCPVLFCCGDFDVNRALLAHDRVLICSSDAVTHMCRRDDSQAALFTMTIDADFYKLQWERSPLPVSLLPLPYLHLSLSQAMDLDSL